MQATCLLGKKGLLVESINVLWNSLELLGGYAVLYLHKHSINANRFKILRIFVYEIMTRFLTNPKAIWPQVTNSGIHRHTAVFNLSLTAALEGLHAAWAAKTETGCLGHLRGLLVIGLFWFWQ